MSVFDDLEAQYNEVDQLYAPLEFKASTRGWVRKEKLYQEKREINDQAYFLFMFTRLEDHIREETTKLIAQKMVITSWKQRAPWDLLFTASGRDRLNFKDRLALLVDKSTADYALVVVFYKERNSIAHGGNFTTSINMPTVILDFKRLYKALRA